MNLPKPEVAVFAIADTYQIMVYTEIPSLMYAKVGQECYYDDSNGIMRSNTLVHRMTVPMAALDACGEYTVVQRPIVERKPYFTETEDAAEFHFSFRPVQRGAVRAYHLSDTHNRTEAPLKAAAAFGEMDFLILNGDIPDHSGKIENCLTIYKLASEITKGSIPVIFSRGNHDMRGVLAEHFAEYTPTDNGKSYYTFRLGSIWGIVLDCGEDKPDAHAAYGHTICCHAFRQRVTRFMKDVIRRAGQEYAAEGITHKLVICHMPFTFRYPATTDQFDIENDIYDEWVALLREHIKPDMIINGHMHYQDVYYPGGKMDHRGQSCPVVLSAAIDGEANYYSATGFTFDEAGTLLTLTDSDSRVLKEERL